MMYRRFMPWVLGALIAAAGWSQAPAPPPPPGAPPAPIPRGIPVPDFAFAGQTASFQFVGGEPVFWGTPVLGAPYSADTVSTTTRVLADGTRIENKSTSKVYRDSEGRTRREQSFPFVGALVADNADRVLQIAITDPVAKKTILLDTAAKTARMLGVSTAPPQPPSPPTPLPPGNFNWESTGITVPDSVEPSGGAAAVVVARRASVAPASPATNTFLARHSFVNTEDVKVEELGVQQIEGVAATGVRRTVTIATGTIGNDRPITSTTEEWFSQELGMTVKRVTKDPQVGEIVYQVQNLNRNEPAKDLFEVPADYTVVARPNVMIPQALLKQ